MAGLKVIPGKPERVVVLEPVTPETYSLELSAEEAGVLIAILRNIGGSPAGFRGKAASVVNALYQIDNAKVAEVWDAAENEILSHPRDNSIYFV